MNMPKRASRHQPIRSDCETAGAGASAASAARVPRAITVREISSLADSRMCLFLRYTKQNNSVRRDGRRKLSRPELDIFVLPQIATVLRGTLEPEIGPVHCHGSFRR